MADYFAGDISLDELTSTFDDAMDKIEAAMDEEEFQKFADVLEELGLVASESAQEVTGALSSFEQWQAKLKGVSTEQVQAQKIMEHYNLSIQDAAEAVNWAANATEADFDTLADSLDISTGELQGMIGALDNILDERQRLQKQLYELQGKTAELRKMELEQLFPSNKELQKRIWSLQDEQKITNILSQVTDDLAKMGMTDLESSIYDIEQRTDDYISQLNNLNASEEQLSTIREWSNKKIEELRKQEEQRIQDQIKSIMSGPMEELTKMDMSDLEAQIYDIEQQASSYVSQLEELSASEEELAVVREWAANKISNLEKQEEERIQSKIRSIVSGPLDELEKMDMTDLEKSIYNVRQQKNAWISDLNKLEASEQSLAVVREWASAKISELKEAEQERIQSQIQSLLSGPEEYLETLDMSNLEKQIYEIGEEADNLVADLKELGASEQELAKVREWESEKIKELKKNAEAQRQSQIESIITQPEDYLATHSMDDLEKSIYNIRQQEKEWIEDLKELDASEKMLATVRDWAKTKIDELREQEQARAQEKQRAALEKEYEKQQKIVNEAKQNYISALEEEASQYEQTQSEMESLIASLDDFQSSLIFDASSPVPLESQFAAAQSEFATVSSAARSGDIDAVKELESVSAQYLELAKRTGIGYDSAYADIQKALNSTSSEMEKELTVAEKQLGKLDDILNELKGDSPEDKSISELRAIWQEEKEKLSAIGKQKQQFEEMIGQNTSQQKALDEINETNAIIANRMSSITNRRMSDIDNQIAKTFYKTILEHRGYYDDGVEPTKMAEGGILRGPQSGYPVSFEAHGIEYITPDSQMKEVVAELRQLRAEVAQLREQTEDQTDYMEKWDTDGLQTVSA
jgi:hypothetical protein